VPEMSVLPGKKPRGDAPEVEYPGSGTRRPGRGGEDYREISSPSGTL
jgi:hypothetical protein